MENNNGMKGKKHRTAKKQLVLIGLMISLTLIFSSTFKDIPFDGILRNEIGESIIQNDTLTTSIYDSNSNPIYALEGYLSGDMYEQEIAREKFNRTAYEISAFGNVVTTGAVTNQVVHPLDIGTAINVPPTSGVQINISSSSVEDSVGGTGIRSIHLHYLDGNLTEQEEEIYLNGTNAVKSNATDIRFIQCMHIGEVGSARQAAGNIKAFNGNNTIYSYIKAGERRCTSSARRVPAGYRLMIKTLYGGAISGNADSACVIRLASTYFENHDYTEDAITIPLLGMSVQDNSVTFPIDMPFFINEGAVVVMEVTCDKAAIISAGYYGYFEKINS